MMVVFGTWSSPEAIVIGDLIPLPEMKPGQGVVQKSNSTRNRRHAHDRPQEASCCQAETADCFAAFAATLLSCG